MKFQFKEDTFTTSVDYFYELNWEPEPDEPKFLPQTIRAKKEKSIKDKIEYFFEETFFDIHNKCEDEVSEIYDRISYEVDLDNCVIYAMLQDEDDPEENEEIASIEFYLY